MSKNTPQSNAPFRVSKDGNLGVAPSPKTFGQRLDEIDNVVKAVVFVLVVMVAGMIIATVAMYLDQSHFNSEMYKEQSGSFQSQLANEQAQVKTMQAQIDSQQTEIDTLKSKVGN